MNEPRPGDAATRKRKLPSLPWRIEYLQVSQSKSGGISASRPRLVDALGQPIKLTPATIQLLGNAPLMLDLLRVIAGDARLMRGFIQAECPSATLGAWVEDVERIVAALDQIATT